MISKQTGQISSSLGADAIDCGRVRFMFCLLRFMFCMPIEVERVPTVANEAEHGARRSQGSPSWGR
jgi:hypothetical protein